MPNWVINIYLMLRWHCFVSISANISYPFKVKIGRGSRIGKCCITPTKINNFDERYQIVIGANTLIHRDVHIYTQGGKVTIGDGVSINPFCVLYGYGGLTIGNDTRIATSTLIIASIHEMDNPNKKIADSYGGEGIKIGKDVWIAAGARILDGVNIGDRSVIGAGAVVNRSIPTEKVAVGVPAKVIKSRFK